MLAGAFNLEMRKGELKQVVVISPEDLGSILQFQVQTSLKESQWLRRGSLGPAYASLMDAEAK